MTLVTPAPPLIPAREWARATTTGYTAVRLIPMDAPLHRQDLAEGWAVSNTVADARRAGFNPARDEVHLVGAPVDADGRTWWRITAVWRPRTPTTTTVLCHDGPAAGAHMVTTGGVPATLLAHNSRGATRVVLDPVYVPIGGPQQWELHPYQLAAVTPDGAEAHYTHTPQED